jgi:hypothetical protein
MSTQAELLYLKTTGHVLSVFTRVGETKDPEKDSSVFTGDSLLVNGLGDPGAAVADWAAFNQRPKFLIPGDQISLFRADLDPSVLAQPRSLCLVNLNSSPSVQAVSSAPPKVDTSSAAISLHDPVPSDLSLVVVIEGQHDPIVIPKTMTNSGTPSGSVTLPPLAPGDYFAVVFLATYPISVKLFTV